MQLHGGYGYMNEYQVARDYVDVRIQTIFGGTTEIMKEIIGKRPRPVATEVAVSSSEQAPRRWCSSA